MVDRTVAQDGHVCTSCETRKEFSEFNLDRRHKFLVKVKMPCKLCRAKLQFEKRRLLPDSVRKQERDSKARRRPDVIKKLRVYHREAKLKSRFNLTLADLNVMLENRNFRCDICEDKIVALKEEGDDHRDVACVDHDHKTGIIRGILCHSCNTALGLFKDSVILLMKACEYLEVPS